MFVKYKGKVRTIKHPSLLAGIVGYDLYRESEPYEDWAPVSSCEPFEPSHNDIVEYEGQLYNINADSYGQYRLTVGIYAIEGLEGLKIIWRSHKPKEGDVVRITKSKANWASGENDMDYFTGRLCRVMGFNTYGNSVQLELINATEEDRMRFGGWNWVWTDGHMQVVSEEDQLKQTNMKPINHPFAILPIGSKIIDPTRFSDVKTIRKYNCGVFRDALNTIYYGTVHGYRADIKTTKAIEIPKIPLEWFRDSFDVEYLKSDWRERIKAGDGLVVVDDRFLTHASEVIMTTDNKLLHKSAVGDGVVQYNERLNYYVLEDNAVTAWYKNNEEPIDPNVTSYIDINDEFYVDDYTNKAFHEIVYFQDLGRFGFLEDGYYDESEDCYYSNDYERPAIYRFDYHSGFRTDRRKADTIWSIGFEVEKEDEEALERHEARELFDSTGWAKERDGSLDSDSGFELVSPTFDLYNTDFPLEFNKVKYLLNADYTTDHCGGHINLGHANMSGDQLFDMLSGYMPMLYSIYNGRIHKSYCIAKAKNNLKRNRDKYSSVFIKDSYIEFRIFSAVPDMNTLLWRTELIKLMTMHPTKDEFRAIMYMADVKHPICQHLMKVYSAERMVTKIRLAIKYLSDFEKTDLTQAKLKRIDVAIIKSGFMSLIKSASSTEERSDINNSSNV